MTLPYRFCTDIVSSFPPNDKQEIDISMQLEYNYA